MRLASRFPFALRGFVLASGVLTSGCLIEAPVDLEEPQQISPRVLTHTAIPVVTTPVQTTTELKPLFQVKFDSEDLGEKVIGKLWLNYESSGSEILLGTHGVNPGSIDDEPQREMQVPWINRQNLSSGCYSVTMTITHSSNYETDYPEVPIDSDRTAFVTWWIYHNVAAQDVTLEDCIPPTPTPETL
jgi:hypothetical protein